MRGQQRLAGLLAGNVPGGEQPAPTLGYAEVTDVTAAGAPDGQALVEILWRGATFDCPWLDTAPPLGAAVLVAKFGPDVVILGRIRGIPAT